MEEFLTVINNFSERICCINDYFFKDDEKNYNETFQDVNNYYSYFNPKQNLINNDVFDRSLFTSIGHGNEYLELSRNNKLFGSPVSLKSYVQNSKNKTNQQVFEHLEITQHDVPTKLSYQINEPINYFKNDQVGGIIIPKSKFVSQPSNQPTIKNSNLPNSNNIPTYSKPNASTTKLKIDQVDQQINEENYLSKEKYLNVPTNNCLHIKSNPPFSKVNENLIQKTPSMPVIRQHQTTIKYSNPIKYNTNSTNNDDNQIILTKYGAYLLGL